jgi:predicted phosphoadenosine phosphosulfate sulfurtransferase
MGKTYLTKNVYDALQERLITIFNEFDNISVSFSGGKDSGLLLNLVVKFMREHHITRKIGVFHQDFEAQYTETTNYVERTMTQNLDIITPYWVCMPMKCKTATSQYEQYWMPWDPDKQDIWVRDMPEHNSVINLDNHKFDFYKYGMLQEDLYAQFGSWYHRHECSSHGKTISLIGIRAQESLNRWRAVTDSDKGMYNDLKWTTKTTDNVYSGYPLYDWTADDVWIANAKFKFDYNKLYDLFYHAGLTVHQMRVASPFNDWAIGSLKVYRAIEPNVWGKMIGRVNGANFSSIYGGTHALAWKHIKLPQGHTWKSYVEFLLKTLPEETRKTYEEKFKTSIEFWHNRGGVLSDQTVAELQQLGIDIQIKGKTKYDTDKNAVTFSEYPDDVDVKEFQTVPSYKRMCICILKNDHLCKYMGFSQTKVETERRRAAIEKYRNL